MCAVFKYTEQLLRSSRRAEGDSWRGPLGGGGDGDESAPLERDGDASATLKKCTVCAR